MTANAAPLSAMVGDLVCSSRIKTLDVVTSFLDDSIGQLRVGV